MAVGLKSNTNDGITKAQHTAPESFTPPPPHTHTILLPHPPPFKVTMNEFQTLPITTAQEKMLATLALRCQLREEASYGSQLMRPTRDTIHLRCPINGEKKLTQNDNNYHLL